MRNVTTQSMGNGTTYKQIGNVTATTMSTKANSNGHKGVVTKVVQMCVMCGQVMVSKCVYCNVVINVTRAGVCVG